ncbi:YbgF trimerization domain-containing protein, partial [Lichenihabitans sp. Uapishka_5]
MRSPLSPILGAISWGVVLTTGAFAGDVRPHTAPLILAQADDDQPSADQQAPQSQGAGVAAMTVRVDRMENTIRQLTGQIEELQFQNRKLTDDLRKMQEDVDFRFQDLNRAGGAPAKPARRSDADPAPVGVPSATGVVVPPDAAPKLRRSGDAFDPAA